MDANTTTTTTEVRKGRTWQIETRSDGSRTETTEYVMELANMDGGPPKRAVRTGFRLLFGRDGRSLGWSRYDIGRPYTIGDAAGAAEAAETADASASDAR